MLVASDDPAAPGLARAVDEGVPVAVIDRGHHADRASFEAALSEALAMASPDVLCLAGFMRVLSPNFVAAREGRILNVHPSLLPAYPGLDTHARVLAAKEARTGCTVHGVTAALDAGPILGRAEVAVRAADTPATLGARVLEAEHRLYPAVLRRFADGTRGLLTL